MFNALAFEGDMGSFQFGAVNAKNKFLLENKSSFPWDLCPIVQLLGHMVSLFLALKQLPKYSLDDCTILHC